MTLGRHVLATAGATVVMRGGRSLAANFGSTATEVAACRSALGIGDCSALAKIELRGRRSDLEALLCAVTGAALEPGMAAHSHHAWWCAVTPHRVLLLTAADRLAKLTGVLARSTGGTRGVSMIDLTDDYAALALVGPRAEAVVRGAPFLAGLPDVLEVGDFTTLSGGMILREVREHFTVLVPRSQGPRAWDELIAAGREHGAIHVGCDALDRIRISDELRR